MLPFVALAFAVVYVGYVAYDARLTKERLAREPPFDGRAAVRDLAAANDQITREARETQALLARTRETLRRGIKG